MLVGTVKNDKVPGIRKLGKGVIFEQFRCFLKLVVLNFLDFVGHFRLFCGVCGCINSGKRRDVSASGTLWSFSLIRITSHIFPGFFGPQAVPKKRKMKGK